MNKLFIAVCGKYDSCFVLFSFSFFRSAVHAIYTCCGCLSGYAECSIVVISNYESATIGSIFLIQINRISHIQRVHFCWLIARWSYIYSSTAKNPSIYLKYSRLSFYSMWCLSISKYRVELISYTQFGGHSSSTTLDKMAL